MEGRLEDMLSRIAMETQEIKELEQQLTDGQILANKCLQRDLEGIISGLQDYLRGLRDQARRAQQEVDRLTADNQSLQLHLEDTRGHCRRLEDAARTHRQDMSVQQEELSLGRMEAQTLTDRQVDLEAELQQLREELTRPTTLGQEHVVRQQAQLVHNKNHIAQLEAQVVQDQDHIAQLEAQVVQDQDHIAQLEAQLFRSLDQDQEMERLRVSLQRSESRNRLVQHKLEADLDRSGLQLLEVQRDRDGLRHQLRSQSDSHQRSLGRLDRKLRRLSRTMWDSDQLTADQLRSTSDQMRDLNHMVELLHTQTNRGQISSLGSLGTQDSGLGLQDRGGFWVYVPPTHSDSGTAAEWRDQDRDRGGDRDQDWDRGGDWDQDRDLDHGGDQDRDRGGDQDQDRGGDPDQDWDRRGDRARDHRGDRDHGRRSRGWTPPVPAGPGGPGGPVWLLTDRLTHTADRCVCESLHREAERLEEEKKKLRHTLGQHRGVMQVCEEVECVENTLLKRRAELRDADRLLLEAQSCINTSREQQGALLRAEELRRISVKSELNSHTAELKLLLQEILEEQQALEEVKTKRTHSLQQLLRMQEELHRKQEELLRTQEELHRKQEELLRTQEELFRTQEKVHRMQEELTELQQEVASCRKEAGTLRLVDGTHLN